MSTGLVVGVDGQIGSFFFSEYLHNSGHELVGTTRNRSLISERKIFLDLDSNPVDVPDFSQYSFAVICASLTDVQCCEENWELCKRVNVTNTIHIIERAVTSGCFVVFLSSNLVFDGSKPFCTPLDAPKPASNYGKAKHCVEEFISSDCGHFACVLRLTKVISDKTPFIQKWKKDASQKGIISVLRHKTLAPVGVDEVAGAIRRCLDARLPGTFQLGGKTEFTYEDYATFLFQNMGSSPPQMRVIDSFSGAGIEYNSLATVLP